MGLGYVLGGASTALAVIGACKMQDGLLVQKKLMPADMLFTGDGEAFNVRSVV